ncbi:hypothetical protein [Actinoplanes siamensis]|uniref:Plasmid replication, integration and excision activator n=1 Tax=Actinoplanes siamensis TaxID=1223317 RepID=A0A919NFY8_9ACTN|nr:hypothetical protein [Actinoplanes siamensis]GIF09810.1 hypothetical protein Asi03nite_73480 [Actinoplanes siamensis]
MVPLTLKVPVPFGYVFPAGVLCLGVEAAVDFDRRHEPDNQMRDKETGERVWVVRVLDLDPAAGKFGRTSEVKVKISAPHQPVPPASAVPGYPPSIEFEGLTLTPYVDSQRCKSAGPCKARMAYSLRATAIRPAAVGVAA